MLLQRWEAKIRQKEKSLQPGIELTTTRSSVRHTHHWATRAGRLKIELNSLTNDKTLHWSNLKAFADDRIYVTEILKSFPKKGKKSIFCFFHYGFKWLFPKGQPRPRSSVVSVLDSWLMTRWLRVDPRLRRLFFLAYFRLSPLHMRKVVGGFGKKSCVSTGVRKPGNTYAWPTAMIWP